VAGQAIVARIRLSMAVHAPLHRHSDPGSRRRLFALSNLSMTGVAFQFSQHHMTAMREKDMVRLLVEPLPGNLLFLFVKGPDLFFFRAVSDGILVALHAEVDPGHSGKGLLPGVGVACGALHPLIKVLLVVERDGLSCPGVYAKADDDKKEKETDYQSEKEEPHNVRYPIKSRILFVSSVLI
jgi:hypothetical protein